MSLHHMLRAAAGSAPSDPNFKNVSLLLTGDGTNGSQNNTFVDSSTNNFTITRNGNTTQGTFSPYGNLWSNYFDGSGDDLRADSNAAFAMGTGNFTFECWLNPANWSATYAPVFVVAGTGGLWIGKNGSNFVIRAFGVADQLTYATMPTVSAWTHIVAVRSGTTLSLYYNGTRVATTTNSYNFAQAAIAVGSDRDPSTPSYYTGYVSNLRLVKGTAVYDPTQSTITVPTTPLTAISGTSLLTCQSNRFIDNSSNNFTITRNGDVKVTKFSPFNPTAPYSAATIGGSGYFDGTGDYLSRSFTSTTDGMYPQGTTYTLEAWIYMTSTSGVQIIYESSATNTGSFGEIGILVSSGSLVAGVRPTTGGTAVSISGGTIVANTWNHVAVSVNAGSARLFLNGTQVGSTTTFSAATFTPVGAAVGRYPNGYTTGITDFTGYISNLRLVQGLALYTANFTPPTAPLTAITNTSLLLNFTNAGIPDAAMQNDLETVGNAQVSTSVKKYGTGSLYFDGTGDNLTTAYSPNLSFGTGDFTIECWVNLAAAQSDYTIINGYSGASTTSGYCFRFTSTGLRLIYRDGSTTDNVVDKSASLSTSNWYHIAFVRNSGSYSVYVNGTIAGTASSLTANINALSTAPVYIGTGYNGNFQTINGYIDDLRITKGLARYTANFTPPTAALPTY